MAITVNNTFFPDSIATHMTCVRKRLTFVKKAETGYEPFRRAIQPVTIRVWTLQSLPLIRAEFEGIANDLEKVRDLWEAHEAQLHNFYFRPPNNRTVRSGQGVISGGLYYVKYRSFQPDGTTEVKSKLRQVFPESDVVTGGGGTTWTGRYYVAARFSMDELEEETEGENDTIILPNVQVEELIIHP